MTGPPPGHTGASTHGLWRGDPCGRHGKKSHRRTRSFCSGKGTCLTSCPWRRFSRHCDRSVAFPPCSVPTGGGQSCAKLSRRAEKIGTQFKRNLYPASSRITISVHHPAGSSAWSGKSGLQQQIQNLIRRGGGATTKETPTSSPAFERRNVYVID